MGFSARCSIGRARAYWNYARCMRAISIDVATDCEYEYGCYMSNSPDPACCGS